MLASSHRAQGIYPENLKLVATNTVYWGGWHVGSVKILASAQHLSLARHLNEAGGIYTHRWNDQV
jgi:hypothetical protein